MARLEIGFDVDGVILDYTNRYAEVFKMFGGTYDAANVSEFNFYNVIPVEEHTKVTLAFGYMMKEPLKGHVDFISMIKYMILEKKQHLNFITARTEELGGEAVRKSIANCLSMIFGPSRAVNSMFTVECVNGNGVSKIDAIRRLGLEYFIDDRRKTCLDLSQQGIKMFMPRRPWNKLPENTPGIIQYDDSAEVVKLLREL